ncbi:hypothetical protein HaLaN_05889 [Haematococcus lacustris]|uniref:Uncharacterized protein n=1 Tax=Haematococcus lacustris TaxID=44745 RepID=A0A699YJZ1_HAELA|nr:hypothetical protein HaLaN_05889 [Haematococcus lacustris]
MASQLNNNSCTLRLQPVWPIPPCTLVEALLVTLLCVVSCRHTTEEQDEQTMPPSMCQEQQGWASARSIAAEALQQTQQVPALLRLLRSQPDSKVMLQLSTLQDAEGLVGYLHPILAWLAWLWHGWAVSPVAQLSGTWP